MSVKQKRYFLKDKEAKTLLSRVSQKLKINLEHAFEKTSVEIVETESIEFFLINGKLLLFKIEENIFPTLVFNEIIALIPKVVVDMGAVPYVCNGASVMAPGIRRFEGQFEKGDIVVVVDERHGKPIAIGEVGYDSEEAKNVRQGAVVRNIHFVGDKVWDLAKIVSTKS